jgi:hypothetical protein
MSPAGRYAHQEQEFFKNWDAEFSDPHEGRGGFGASTAQIALLQGFKEGYETLRSQSQFDFDLRRLHRQYLQLAHTPGSGTLPSGADLLAQFQGGLVEINFETAKIQRQSWPFPQWQVLFFATGSKLATHEHLQQLHEPDLSSLRQIYHRAMAALANQVAAEFAQAFGDYQQNLFNNGWESESTGHFIKQINQLEGVVGSKGCGAMGSDVIAVLVETQAQGHCVSALQQLGLTFVGSLEQRTEGFSGHPIIAQENPANAKKPMEELSCQ